MNHFINLRDLLQSLRVDPSTSHDPVKRMFICDGEFLTANIATGGEAGGAIHTQPGHDEIIIVLEGEAEFRVGDETRQIALGDMVFIPRNTPHGRVRLTPRPTRTERRANSTTRRCAPMGVNVSRQNTEDAKLSVWRFRP